MLNKQIVREWLDILKNAWLNKDLDKISQIFCKTKEYYETRDAECIDNIDDIILLWKEIETQKIDYIIFIVIAVENITAAVKWVVKIDDIEEEGIYQIKFNENNECIYFKQICLEK